MHAIVLGGTGGLGRLVRKVEGYAAVTSTDARTLFGQLQAQQPEITKLGIKPDGRFHPVSGIPVPFPIHGGVGDRAIVVAIGATGKSLGEPIIAARPREAVRPGRCIPRRRASRRHVLGNHRDEVT